MMYVAVIPSDMKSMAGVLRRTNGEVKNSSNQG